MPFEKIIGIIGDANLSKKDIKWKCAFEIGKLVIENEYRLANGGMGGVMEASLLGAKSSEKYRNGATISILPDYNKDSGNHLADIIIPTGLGLGRNIVLVSMCDAIIAIGGGSGTLSEIALAWQMNKLIVAINFEGWSGKIKSLQLDERRNDKIFEAENAEKAMEIIKDNIEDYKNTYIGVKKPRLGKDNAINLILNKFKITGQITFLGKGSEGYVFKDDKKVYKIIDNNQLGLNLYWKLKALSEDIKKFSLKHLIKFNVYIKENVIIVIYDYFESKSFKRGFESELISIAKELKRIGWIITDFQPKNLVINKETELPTIIDIGNSFEPYSKNLFRKMCRKMYLSSLIGNIDDIKAYLTETNLNEKFISLKNLGFEPKLVNKNFKSFFRKIIILDKYDILNPLIERIIQETSDIKTVFDYGSGKGDISFSIKKLGFDVTAYDPDINQFEKYKDKYYKGITFISKEKFNDFFKTGKKFDCVLLSLVLCHPLHNDKNERVKIINEIIKDIILLSSHYIIIAICNPLYSIKLKSSLQEKKLFQDFDYLKENKIEKHIKSSRGKRFDYHRPISYYEKLFQEYNMKIIRIEQTIGENLDNPNIFYSDFLIYLLEVNKIDTAI